MFPSGLRFTSTDVSVVLTRYSCIQFKSSDLIAAQRVVPVMNTFHELINELRFTKINSIISSIVIIVVFVSFSYMNQTCIDIMHFWPYSVKSKK